MRWPILTSLFGWPLWSWHAAPDRGAVVVMVKGLGGKSFTESGHTAKGKCRTHCASAGNRSEKDSVVEEGTTCSTLLASSYGLFRFLQLPEDYLYGRIGKGSESVRIWRRWKLSTPSYLLGTRTDHFVAGRHHVITRWYNRARARHHLNWPPRNLYSRVQSYPSSSRFNEISGRATLWQRRPGEVAALKWPKILSGGRQEIYPFRHYTSISIVPDRKYTLTVGTCFTTVEAQRVVNRIHQRA